MNGAEKMGMGATAIGGVLGAAGMAAQYMGQRPIDIARMQSSAISMTTGRQLGEARSGEYTYESMYGQDRAKANEQASSSDKWKTAGDLIKGLGGLGLLAVGGTAIATGGLSLGALAIAGAGLGLMGSSNGVLDPSKYAAYKEQRQATDFTTMLASLHDMDPYRKDAIERLKSTGARDLGMERTLGLKDAEYYGSSGYLQSQMGTSFTDDMVTKASQDILGASGSTAMSLQSGTALKAERGLGLTNATSLLGQLSGTLTQQNSPDSIPETSKKALIDIFARGFDASKYAEENRRYMQAVTEQVYRGGTTSPEQVNRVADMMHAAIGEDPTMRKVEAGKAAFEAYQSNATSTSGFLGGINLTSAMQDSHYRKLGNVQELMAILKLKPSEMPIGDPDFEASAKKMGFKNGEELAKYQTEQQQKNMKKGATNGGVLSGSAEIGQIQTLNPGMDWYSASSYKKLLNQQPSSERDVAMKKLEDAAKAKFESKETGRAGDPMIQASAQNAKISLDTLSASINKFADDALAAAKKLGGSAPAGRAAQNSLNSAEEALDKSYKNPNYHNNIEEQRAVEAARKAVRRQEQGN